MLFVICGAGASYGCVPDEIAAKIEEKAIRPPLTKHLFAHHPGLRALLKPYPACTPLVAKLQPIQSTSHGFLFERALAKAYAERERDPQRARQVAAVTYYLRDVMRAAADQWRRAFGGATAYATLVDSMRHHNVSTGEPVRIVTFNYDTLIDRCVEESFDLKFDHMDRYISDARVKLYRPHGCEQWVRPITNSREIEGLIVTAGMRRGVRTSSGMDQTGNLILYADKIQRGDRDSILVDVAHPDGAYSSPALAIPLEGKDALECPTRHEQCLRDDISQATGVIIIGWRGAEVAFNKMWAKELPPGTPVQVVASNRIEAFKIAQSLRGQGWRMTSHLPACDGFSHYVHVDEIQVMLDPERRNVEAMSADAEIDALREEVATRTPEARDSLHREQLFQAFMDREWPSI